MLNLRAISYGSSELKSGEAEVNRCHRWSSVNTLIVCFALFSALATAVAQEKAKLAPEKWRPKDGLYIRAAAEFTGPCEYSAPYLLELGKKHFVVDERWGCKITKIADTAPGAIRLDMTCNETDNPDEGDGKDYKEAVKLRKIDDASFYMQLTNKGKAKGAPWRVNYCERLPPEELAALPDPAEEARRKAVKDQIGGAAWQPRDGVYATPGADFDDRCMKSGDAVIGLANLFVSGGASHCEASKVEESSVSSIKLEARCDLKPGQTGQVPRSKGGEIVFVPVGTENIIITSSSNQTVTLQKSRNGEFSGPGQLLAYCPDPAQRAYVDSKKAK